MAQVLRDAAIHERGQRDAFESLGPHEIALIREQIVLAEALEEESQIDGPSG